jgi:hypothetical protein
VFALLQVTQSAKIFRRFNTVSCFTVSLMENRGLTQLCKPVSISPSETNSHVANMHLIPADGSVASRLKEVFAGQVVTHNGYLVQVAFPDGGQWKSSVSRTDAGGGACELMWVQRLAVR